MQKTQVLTDTERQEFVKEHSDRIEPCIFCSKTAQFRATSKMCGCTKFLCAGHWDLIRSELAQCLNKLTMCSFCRVTFFPRSVEECFEAVRI